MFSQMSQNNFRLDQQIQALNKAVPTQVDHFTYAMMLRRNCRGGGVNIGSTPVCTTNCL